MTPEKFREKRRRDRHAMKRAARLQMQMPPMPMALRAPIGIQAKSLSGYDAVQQHPELGLTPQQVISIYRLAEQGWTCHQTDLFEGIVENDGHLRATVENRINAIAGKEWQVLAGADDARSMAAADLLETSLKGSNFGNQIAHLLQAPFIGFSALEIVWQQQAAGIVPAWFVDVPSRRFAFDDLTDQPELINQAGNSREPLIPGKWIFVKSRNPFGGKTARAGLLRTALWYSLFKRWSWRDWVIYSEKFGIPLVIGKYRHGATEPEKSALQEAVEDIGEAGQALMSDETEIDIVADRQGGDNDSLHRAIVREANEEISKLITGSTLTMATGGNGSFAQASVHASTSFANVQADHKLLQDHVHQHLVMPFLRFNGFEGVAPPRLVVHIKRDTDGKTRLEEFQIAQGLGLELDAEQVREELHFRAPPTSDRVLAPAAPEPMRNDEAETDE